GEDYDMAIYDEEWSKGPIGSSAQYGNIPEEVILDLQPGKYYVRLLFSAGVYSDQKYRLQVND
ncbi:MAG: hypothetical protein ACK2UK_06690, partial [Candidatus Promineifilaceae bacterium]